MYWQAYVRMHTFYMHYYNNIFSLVCIVDDRPGEIYLNRHIKPHLCAACDVNPQAWKNLGLELMPDTETELTTISAQYRNVMDCCSSMFQLWLQRNPNPSWKLLIETLKKINLNNLAAEVEGMLISSVDTATESIVPVMPSEGNHLYKVCIISNNYILMFYNQKPGAV